MKIIILLLLTLFFSINIFAWEGEPTPPLHVEGNKLKDPTGKDVLLHGWMQPTSSWFNGIGKWYSDPYNWNDKNNIAGLLNYMKNVATLMSDTSPKYGQKHGWYTSFVRVNTDAIGGWTSQSGLVDTSQFNAWIKNFLVPYAKYLSSRGLYLVLSATGPINTPDNGTHNAGQTEQARLRTFWSTVASNSGVKNANNIMFELMNEPVDIESSPGNGDWGNHQDKYFSAFKNWVKPIIDDIRNTGANNIIWVPTLEWQGSPYQWDRFPFTGSNIGVACHYYPAYGGVFNNPTAVQNLWDLQYKPAADRWPMIITEMFWTPYPNDPWNLVNGNTVGFGNAVRKAIDNQGNVSYIVGFIGDLIENLNNSLPANCYLSPGEGAQSYFTWLPEYKWAAPDDGTPKYKYASVNGDNPKQIKVIIGHPAKKLNNYSGFTVRVDSQIVKIDSIALADTNQLVIYLNDSILKNNEIRLSYSNGNVVSIYEKELVPFNEEIVDNLLKGASPRITELSTNENGNTLLAKFNMKMHLPSDLSALTISSEYSETKNITVLQSSFLNNDSSKLLFSLAEQVYSDYRLLLTYTGNNIVSSDSSILKLFSDYPVINNSKGLPMHIDSGRIESNSISVILEFSKPLAIAVGQSGSFTLKVNSKSVPIKDFFVLNNTIRFTLLDNLHFGDIATISYTPGNISATDKGILNGFNNIQLENFVIEPKWSQIPDRVEAENYSLQSGIQTENTSDVGGGLDVGWIDNGDWLEFAIENNTLETNFKITFRLASPNADGKFDYYIDNNKIKGVSIPNTGGWQTWQSVFNDIAIKPGKHYLKVVASTGGFNINYIDIKQIGNGVKEISDAKINIYPNPVLNRITIKSTDFQYHKVEFIDILGNTVLEYNSTTCEPELHISVNLLNGIYFVKVSNENQCLIKKIIVKNR